MNDLPLVALRAFAIVYQTGGIRAAASKLGIAHSSVSCHVRELEARLGTALTVQQWMGQPFVASGIASGLVFDRFPGHAESLQFCPPRGGIV